jgi:hypothetical protein
MRPLPARGALSGRFFRGPGNWSLAIRRQPSRATSKPPMVSVCAQIARAASARWAGIPVRRPSLRETFSGEQNMRKTGDIPHEPHTPPKERQFSAPCKLPDNRKTLVIPRSVLRFEAENSVYTYEKVLKNTFAKTQLLSKNTAFFTNRFSFHFLLFDGHSE